MTDHAAATASLLLVLSVTAGVTQARADDTDPAQSLVESVERSGQSYVYPDPEIPTQEDAPGYRLKQLDRQQQRFEYRLWTLLSAGNYQRVRSEIAQKQQSQPGWKPEPHLMRELVRGETGRAINAARKKPEAFIAISRRYPERFSCYEYYNLWSLSDAYAKMGKQAVASDIDRQVIASCKQADVILKTLDRINGREGPAAALAVSHRLIGRSDRRVSAAVLRKRQYSWSVAMASALRQKGDLPAVLKAMKPLEPGMKQYRDADAARLLAWTFHDTGDHDAAINWFTHAADWSGSDEDRLFLLQERWNNGQHSLVLEWLMLHQLSERNGKAWGADVLRSEAAKNYNEKRYTLTLDYLDRAQVYSQPEPAGSAVLRGWSLYHIGRYHKAFAAFAEAYTSGQLSHEESVSVSDALLYTTKQTAEWRRLEELADSHKGTLLAEENDRKLVARLVAEELTSSQVQVEHGHLVRIYHGLNETIVSAGFGLHSKRGVGGNDSLLLLQQPLVAAQWSVASGDVYAQVNRYAIDSGRIQDGTWLGSGQWGVDAKLRQVDFNTSGLGGVLVGLKPRNTSLYIEAGRTAEAGAVSPTWMGQLQFATKLQRGEYTAKVYRRPRRDSQLSYVGMDDPFSHSSWGRVMEQGAALDGYSELGGKWKVGAHLALFSLNGVKVADNNGADLYLGLQRQLHSGSHTVFEAGPYLYATAYRRNLNHFTLGHGGYFSPQRLLQPGLSGLWQYQSIDLIYRLRFGVGYQAQHDDSVARFPLADDGTSWASADNRGVTGSLKLSWVKQLGHSPWQWSGLLSAEEGPDHGQRDAWLFLRYNFSGRSDARYDDLPEQMTPSLPVVP